MVIGKNLKKLTHLYVYFNNVSDYQKPVHNLKKEDFFSELKNSYPSDDETNRTKEIIKIVNIKSGDQLIELYIKTDDNFSTDVIKKLFL